MSSMVKYALILLLLLCGNQRVSAQKEEIQKQEQELVKIYEKLITLRFTESDSLNYYSDLFSSKLQNLLSSNKNTLTYSFNTLKDAYACHVETSKDGLFRIYSWDSQLGGTMRFFNVLYQYKTAKTIKTQSTSQLEEGDPAWYCSDIFTLKTKKTTYYLAITNGIYSTKDVGQSIKAFTLSNAGINDSVLLMKTDEGLKNSLDLSYDFFSVIDRPERPVAVIKYDIKKKIISISVTNDQEEVVPGNTTYIFNGTYFEEQITKSKK